VARTIFFSWQSDLDNSQHRNYIEKCIKQALKNLSQNDLAQIYMDYDRDTLGRYGSPDITEVIFDKIEKSILFVCDVSIVTGGNGIRKSPNPNVLIELGFAVKQLGWERVICLFNQKSGDIEDLPFDLRQKRVLAYNPDNPDEKTAS
jgi:predicted nucleotide-binding protein